VSVVFRLFDSRSSVTVIEVRQRGVGQ